MNENAEAGGWCRGRPRAAERSGTPESRPQLKELRSGEWVTQLAARGRPRQEDPPVSYVAGDQTGLASTVLRKAISPLRASATTVSPSANSPLSSRRASGSWIIRWMVRLSGRAP
jgi:hypothetical protein